MSEPTDIERDNSAEWALPLHVANALATLAVLKMEGPVYADYLIAGWCVVSAVSALTLRRKLPVLFVALALFYLASSVSIAWLTWTTPAEHTHEGEETLASALRGTELAKRTRYPRDLPSQE